MPVKVGDLLKKKIPSRPKILKDKMLDYLEKNSDTAFTSGDLRNKFGVKPTEINTRLAVLKKEGKVVHMGMYWFYKPQVRTRRQPKKGVTNKRKMVKRTRRKGIKK